VSGGQQAVERGIGDVNWIRDLPGSQRKEAELTPRPGRGQASFTETDRKRDRAPPARFSDIPSLIFYWKVCVALYA